MPIKIKISKPSPFPCWSMSDVMATWDEETWDEYFGSLGADCFDDALDANMAFSNRGVRK